MTDVHQILRRQAEWQRAQADLPWATKVRLAESLRDSVAQLRLQPARDRSTSAGQKGSE